MYDSNSSSSQTLVNIMMFGFKHNFWITEGHIFIFIGFFSWGVRKLQKKIPKEILFSKWRGWCQICQKITIIYTHIYTQCNFYGTNRPISTLCCNFLSIMRKHKITILKFCRKIVHFKFQKTISKNQNSDVKGGFSSALINTTLLWRQRVRVYTHIQMTLVCACICTLAS